MTDVSSTAILAIDQGTSGTKAIVVGQDGRVLSIAEVPVRPTYLAGGGVEVDPASLLDSVLTAGRRALAEAAPALGGVGVAALALANQGETVLAWDPATGDPLSAAVVWQDSRSQSICDDLAEHASLVAARTGLTLDPYFSAPKLTWLRRNVTRDGVVTTSDAWLVHRLTGEFVTDTATAGRSLLLDVDSLHWDDELLALFDLTGEALPRLVANDEIVGTTTAFGPAATGGGTGSSGLPVTGLIVDQQAALAAQRCLDVGAAKCTFGTGAFLLANTGATAGRSSAGLTTSLAWQTGRGRRYCLDGQVYTAASAIRWLVDLGLLTAAADLDAVAADDSDGVLAVPALAGLAAPWWRGQATATLTGLTLSTERGHVVRAVVDGIAAQVAELVGLVERDLGSPMQYLRVDGGLTHSRVLMQATADLVQVPVEVYPSAHATPLGAAAMARLALDPSLSLDDAVPPWTATTGYEPRWSADRAATFRQRWRDTVEASLSR